MYEEGKVEKEGWSGSRCVAVCDEVCCVVLPCVETRCQFLRLSSFRSFDVRVILHDDSVQATQVGCRRCLSNNTTYKIFCHDVSSHHVK